jgi:hypothetical protein
MARTKGGPRAAGAGPSKVLGHCRWMGGVKVQRRFRSHASSVTRVQQDTNTLAYAAGVSAPCTDNQLMQLEMNEDVSAAFDQMNKVEHTDGVTDKRHAYSMQTASRANFTAANPNVSNAATVSAPAAAAADFPVDAAEMQTHCSHYSVAAAAAAGMKIKTENTDNNDETISSNNSVPKGEFVVDKIVGKRVNENNELLYYVKWAGYLSSENTWEPVSHLTNAAKSIARFEIHFSHLATFTQAHVYC